MLQVFWEAALHFLKKLHRHLPYGPAIPFLGIHPKEVKAYVNTKKKCLKIFIAALYVAAP